jgi:putative zinc finger protein
MSRLDCLWVRSRLERHADGALGARGERFVAAHLARCDGCRAALEKVARFKTLVRQESPLAAEPDWSGFWATVRARIMSEEPRPVRESWWVPFWKPVWGHPRLAFGGVLLAVLVTAFTFWPAEDAAFASPVKVQDVSADDPERSVMVYSSRAHGVTVIWVFGSNEALDTDDDEP